MSDIDPNVESMDEEFPEGEDESMESSEFDQQFDAMLEDYLDDKKPKRGEVIKATVVQIESDYALLDIGGKSEAVVDISEFIDADKNLAVAIGDEIPVMHVGRDEDTGQMKYSFKAARERKIWDEVQVAQQGQVALSGKITQAVNKGVLVDIGVSAFIPASQIDLRPVKNLEDWVGQEVEVVILDCDPGKRRCVVSRRKLEEEHRDEQQKALLESLREGDIREVTIKKIMDFGIFADLGGIDGLIPRSELSWDKNPDPKGFGKVGDTLTVHVKNIDQDKKKITLSRRDTVEDPWQTIDLAYPEGKVVEGEIVHVTPFEAFILIDEGVTGRLHHEDYTWAKGRVNMKSQVKVGDKVETQVLGINRERRRLTLGKKQLEQDPWDRIDQDFPINATVKGKIVSLTDFGAFMALNEFMDGLIRTKDLSWDKNIRDAKQMLEVGQEVEAMVLNIDYKRRKINLGLKQLESNPFTSYLKDHGKKNEIVEGEVIELTDSAAIIKLAEMVDGYMHVSQISSERVEKPSDQLKVGDVVRAAIHKVDKKKQRIELSVREMLKAQEREDIKAFSQTKESVNPFGDKLKLALGIEPEEEETSDEEEYEYVYVDEDGKEFSADELGEDYEEESDEGASASDQPEAKAEPETAPETPTAEAAPEAPVEAEAQPEPETPSESETPSETETSEERPASDAPVEAAPEPETPVADEQPAAPEAPASEGEQPQPESTEDHSMGDNTNLSGTKTESVMKTVSAVDNAIVESESGEQISQANIPVPEEAHSNEQPTGESQPDSEENKDQG